MAQSKPSSRLASKPCKGVFNWLKRALATLVQWTKTAFIGELNNLQSLKLLNEIIDYY
jgi:hypothetical protein